MAQIKWSQLAWKDLRSIHEYVSKDSHLYADRLIVKLISAVDHLQNFPYSGRIVPEKKDETIREVIEGNYRIFYKLQSANHIFILRVYHSARNIK